LKPITRIFEQANNLTTPKYGFEAVVGGTESRLHEDDWRGDGTGWTRL